ncbi:MAG: response regulator [Oligoflexia bacterium]|nr:response regulator [Oligoflexia bacterium]
MNEVFLSSINIYISFLHGIALLILSAITFLLSSEDSKQKIYLPWGGISFFSLMHAAHLFLEFIFASDGHTSPIVTLHFLFQTTSFFIITEYARKKLFKQSLLSFIIYPIIIIFSLLLFFRSPHYALVPATFVVAGLAFLALKRSSTPLALLLSLTILLEPLSIPAYSISGDLLSSSLDILQSLVILSIVHILWKQYFSIHPERYFVIGFALLYFSGIAITHWHLSSYYMEFIKSLQNRTIDFADLIPKPALELAQKGEQQALNSLEQELMLLKVANEHYNHFYITDLHFNEIASTDIYPLSQKFTTTLKSGNFLPITKFINQHFTPFLSTPITFHGVGVAYFIAEYDYPKIKNIILSKTVTPLLSLCLLFALLLAYFVFKLRNHDLQKHIILTTSKIESIISASKQVALYYDKKGTLVEIKGPLPLILGYTTQEFAKNHKEFLHLVHPMFKEVVDDAFFNSFLHKKNIELQYLIKKHDGRYTWIKHRGEWISEIDELLLATMLEDISSYKQIENDLQEQERKLGLIFNNATMGMLLASADGTIKMTNPAFQAILECNTCTLGNCGFFHTLQCLTASSLVPLIREIHGDTFITEKKFLRKNGDPLWLKITINSVRNVLQKVDCYIGAIENITLNKRMEEENGLNEARLESILHIGQQKSKSSQELFDFTLEEAIRLTSSEVGFIYLYDENKNSFQICSWSKNVLNECAVLERNDLNAMASVGHWKDVVAKRDTIIYNNFLEDSKRLPRKYPSDHLQIKRMLSLPVIIDNKVTAVIGVGNKIEAYNFSDARQLTLLMDAVWKIVERQKFIQSLEKSREEAIRANITKTEFFSNISHEIRTPLNSILGLTEVLLTSNLNSEQQLHLHTILKSGDTLLTLLNNTLEVSKMEIGVLDIEVAPFNLAALLDEVTTMLFTKIKAKHLKLEVEIDPILSHPLIGDQFRIKQILINLINNAIKFTHQGFIKISAKSDSNFITISVIDSGMGIPLEKQAELFSRFGQIDATVTRKYEGFGLGLYISKKLTELMGGTITLFSSGEEGKGSTFSFTIPFKESSSLLPINKASTAPQNVENMASSIPLTILLVDDSEDNRNLIKIFFKKLPYTIDVAENGANALEMAKSKPYDLILMDVQMPIMDGLTATQEIRLHEKAMNKKATPIIALTAHAMKGEYEKCVAAGCTSYLAKPIKKNDLLQEILKLTVPLEKAC